jgi:hypothetical protein
LRFPASVIIAIGDDKRFVGIARSIGEKADFVPFRCPKMIFLKPAHHVSLFLEWPDRGGGDRRAAVRIGMLGKFRETTAAQAGRVQRECEECVS